MASPRVRLVENLACGADAIDRGELEFWQHFVRDSVVRRDREGVLALIRCIVIGVAGIGKSRGVGGLVGAKHSIVKRTLVNRYDIRVLQTSWERGRIAESVRHCCRLGVFTPWASFESKYGATTLHRLFAVPVGYCGLAVDRTSKRYRIRRDGMLLVQLYVLDEMSMIGRKMLGKIEFKLRDHLGNAPAVDGSEPVMGQRDWILCGDSKACSPVGDEPIYQDGEYVGTCDNKPFLARGVPPKAWSAKKLVKMGVTIQESCEDVVILRPVGTCGLVADRTRERYRIWRARMRRVELYVLDEMSMIGLEMLGEMLDGVELVMVGKDFVCFGDSSVRSLLDDQAICRDGDYAGICENVVIVCEFQRIFLDADDSVQSVISALCAEEGAEFLRCTRAMVGVTLTLARRNWLAHGNGTVLRHLFEGRAQLESLEKAPLLKDTRVDKLTGRVRADRLNGIRLQELCACSNKPVVALCVRHARSENRQDVRTGMLGADNFRGMSNCLLMFEGACVILTDSIWMEDGLVSGASGTLKRFVSPEGADPNSSDSTKRTFSAVIVEFDEVDLEDESD